jgi:poly-gamma-glutamate capsule biosynthesis protein CapA/YwtB (metallophosphatase superfamily)
MVDKNNKIILVAVGDIGWRIEENNDSFDGTRAILKGADIALGQLEVLLSRRGSRQVHFPGFEASDMGGPTGWLPNPQGAIQVLVNNGFNIMSFASNHTMDMGEEAVLDTLDILRKNNIMVIGAGKNIEEARQPAVLERKGTKVGFLAYCSVVPRGYAATKDTGGVAPVRATTAYEQVDWQPGFPPKVITKANPEDLADMINDIKKLRPQVDVLVISMHWGVHWVPDLIADYQFEIGHAAIDAGADIIIGQHQHILNKGIEVYKGKVIFHSLSNFSMRRHRDFKYRPISASGRYWVVRHGVRAEADPNCPRYRYDINTQKTILVKCEIANRKIQQVAYLPLWLNKEAVPEPLSHSDPRSEEHLRYMQWMCGSQGLDTKFSPEGDDVVILT